MGDTIDWIEEAGKAGLELRELIRQAHEAQKDLKQARKDYEAWWKEAQDNIREVLATPIVDVLRQVGEAHADRFHKEIDLLMKRLDETVMHRVDGAVNTLREAVLSHLESLSRPVL